MSRSFDFSTKPKIQAGGRGGANLCGGRPGKTERFPICGKNHHFETFKIGKCWPRIKKRRHIHRSPACPGFFASERDENDQRKSPTKSEMVALAEAIAAKLDGRKPGPKIDGGNISTNSEVGKTRDIIASKVGLGSGKKLYCFCWCGCGNCTTKPNKRSLSRSDGRRVNSCTARGIVSTDDPMTRRQRCNQNCSAGMPKSGLTPTMENPHKYR